MNLNNGAETGMWRNARWLLRLTALVHLMAFICAHLMAFNRLNALAWQVRKTDYSAGDWRAAKYPAMHYALNNERLKRWGLWVPSDFVTR